MSIHAYHQQTKHHLNAYAPGPGGLDWDTQPDPFRRFEGAEPIPLPLLGDGLDTPFSAVRTGAAVAPRRFDRDTLGLLFEIALGLSAWKQWQGDRWALRCNPSSGNLHPTEAYVVCATLPGLDAGVYHYAPREHAFERRASAEWHAGFGADGVLIGLSSIVWREAWKYGARAFRYCQHDIGHAIAALRYAAAALGWRLSLLDGSADADVAGLLGLDRAQDFEAAEHEEPDALLWLTAADAHAPDIDALRTAPCAWQGRANRLSDDHMHWPQIDLALRAVKPRTTSAHAAMPTLPPLAPPRVDRPAAELYRQRRSAVAFDGVTAMPARAFFDLLDALLPRANVAPWDALPWSPRVHPVLFVHRVDGLQRGVYALPRDANATTLLQGVLHPEWQWQRVAEAPEHLPLYRLLAADCRPAATTLACHQAIAADSCFSLAMLAEFDAVLDVGEWQYRRLFWEAGMLGQVLYLEAESAGLRGTGIGCFFDDAVHDTLGIADMRVQDIYHFTVGGPVEDRRLGTLAPYAGRAPMATLHSTQAIG
jgi:SagB-type dehydrogenase family enzyme